MGTHISPARNEEDQSDHTLLQDHDEQVDHTLATPRTRQRWVTWAGREKRDGDQKEWRGDSEMKKNKREKKQIED